MRHILFGISGYSGVGKDEFAKHLVNRYSAIHTGLADPAKRHMADLYGWGYDQLFGPSEMRNAGDLRQPKEYFTQFKLRPLVGRSPGDFGLSPDRAHWIAHSASIFPMETGFLFNVEESVSKKWPVYWDEDQHGYFAIVPAQHPAFWLSPRESLQKYCELMNKLYMDTWIQHGVDTHKRLALSQAWSYDRMTGVTVTGSASFAHRDTVITCFSDFRHRHEIRFARAARDSVMTPVMIRIRHPRILNPPFNHRSETEQAAIPDDMFDFVIDNNGSIPDLHEKIDSVVGAVTLCGWEPLSSLP